MSAPKGIKPAKDGRIWPLVWRCYCGQFNMTIALSCCACGSPKMGQRLV